MKLSHYTRLARLFEYPDESYTSLVTNMASELAVQYPDASKELEAFSKLLPKDTYRLQELYTKSFEVQAVTSLEIGYLLYGDDYTRGEVMVHLNQEHRAVGNDLGTELSDHLSNVLKLLPQMQDKTVVNDLVTMMVAPAVEIMMHEYTPKNMEAKDKLYKKQYKTLIIPSVPVGMFLHLIKALFMILDSDFALIKENKPFGDASFLGFLTSELEVEEGKKSSNSCAPTFDASGVMTTSSCGSCA
ncbi:MAG: hypothetical protein DRG09_05240 [Epsilonproteobacteria bacterium]|nr:MAG: hypothetical protein DRG09_05240 [Campylobacterota bacterium]